MVIRSPQMFGQKIRYTHENPVRAGICGQAGDYRWSSARYQRLWTFDRGIEITDNMIAEFWDPAELILKSA